MKIIKFILVNIAFIIFVIFCAITITSTVRNIIIQEEVKDFISKASLEATIGEDTFIYSILDDTLDSDTIYYEDDYVLLGETGDIFIMPQSTFSTINLISGFISYSFGGHAGLNAYDKYNDEPVLVEAMGGSIDEMYVYVNGSEEENPDLYKPESRSVIGLRVLTSKENRLKASENAISKEGYDYNYLYIIEEKDKYYCTDFVSRVYSEISEALKIDENGWFVSTQDLYESSLTKVTYFKYVKDNKIYIYYLKKSIK